MKRQKRNSDQSRPTAAPVAPNKERADDMLENRYMQTLVALQRSENEKRAILSGLHGLVTILCVDPHLRVMWANVNAAQELNTEDRATSATHCYEIMHGRTEPCRDCTVIKAFASGKLQEKEHRLDDGRSFVTRSNPIRDGTGQMPGVVQMALNVTTHKQTEEGLKATHEFLHSLLENSPTPIYVSDRNGCISMVNQAWEKIVGVSGERAVGQSFGKIFPKQAANQVNRLHEKILRTGFPVEVEEAIDCPTGLHHFHTIKFPLEDSAGQRTAVGAISVDVTARKRVEQELTKREAELTQKSEQLGEMNTALRVLLRQREEDQRELEERIVSNVKELVLPYVHKLKGMHLNEAQMSYLEIVETHLNDIVAPFLRQMVSQYPRLTAKELQVATFVKEGKTNKEIADLMNVSVNAIEIHRYNLRKKLGLQNKKINLRSYLLSLKELRT
jgi:PAS domain S-box-containing protein